MLLRELMQELLQKLRLIILYEVVQEHLQEPGYLSPSAEPSKLLVNVSDGLYSPMCQKVLEVLGEHV